jgi:hypothetical protein
MENNSAKDTSAKLKALGIYQIAGGVVGFGLTFFIIASLQAFPIVLVFLLLIILGLYAHSVYCGILLLKNDSSGLNHSLANQCLQVLNFSIPGFTFLYVSGCYFTIGLDIGDAFTFAFGLGISSWKITLNSETTGSMLFNFNFVAFFLILFIYRLKKEIRQEQAEAQLDLIGQEQIVRD